MYAIVDIAGKQFKVEQDQHIFVHRLDSKEGSKINFDSVLLFDKNGKVSIGTPFVKGDKVVVFKKKRRKGYRVKNGHRQYLTKLEIQKIDTKKTSKKTTQKKDVKLTNKADKQIVDSKKKSIAKTTSSKKKAVAKEKD